MNVTPCTAQELKRKRSKKPETWKCNQLKQER